MIVENLRPSHAPDFQALRLRGLRESPHAFASSFEEECDKSLDEVAARLAPNPYRAVFGAFGGSALIGVIGLKREEMQKLAHKAHFWGMYVVPEHRRDGVARALVARALQHAFSFSMAGVRQVNLGVHAANLPAIALYEAMGCRSFGLERDCMFVDGAFQDEMHMVYFKEFAQQDN